MARPIKQGLDYFPHDVDASSDEKIDALRMIYGNDGYAFYFITLERIYRSKALELNISDAETRQILARKVSVTPELLDRMIETALKYGCFDQKSYTERGVLTSAGIKKRAQTVFEKREKMRNSYQNRVSASETTEETTAETPQSKVKKSKVKKISDCSANNWRTSFEIYRQMVTDAMEYLINDKTEYEKLQKFNPTLDIKLSLEKSVENFWGTEAGWKNKKSSRSKDIDMVTTLKNNIDKSRVFLQKNINPPQKKVRLLSDEVWN